MTDSTSRLARFADRLRAEGLAAFVACTPVSMGYLAGFFEDGHERLLAMFLRPDGDPAMIVPSLSATQAGDATGFSDIRPWADGEDPLTMVTALMAEWGADTGTIGVDDELAARFVLPLQQALPRATFRAAGDVLAGLRKAKDAAELDTMRRAAAIADQAQLSAHRELAVGMAEREVAARINTAMTDGGGKPTFCVVAAGANGARPHHLTGATALKDGDVVVIDCGCDLDRYQSDTTRTVCVGAASDEAKTVYRVVYEAFMAARNAIRPGVSGEAIDAAARQVIADAGYGEYFIHRTGHGIGMQCHEVPNIVKGNAEGVVVGQCFSVEPGIYLPGKFGVRIENVVTVTADGHESLNNEPPAELQEL